MIGPYESNGKAGAAMGLQESRPGRCRSFGVTVIASRQPDGLLTRRFQHHQVGQGFVCRIRLPGLTPPYAGQPTMVDARRRTFGCQRC